MKKAKGAKGTVSPKLSIEQLKDMPLEKYTKLLVRDMVETLNAKRRGAAAIPERRKSK